MFIPLARAGQVPQSNKQPLTAKEALAAKAKAHASRAGNKAAPKPVVEAAHEPVELDSELVQAGADTAVQAITKAGDAAAALIDAWLAASNAAAIVEVAECESAPAAARKAARRAINVMRARGVSVPIHTRVAKIDILAEVSVEATLLPPDPSGLIVITITSKIASGRYHVGEVAIRDTTGIVQAGAGWLGGTQLKEAKTRAAEGLGLVAVPVPVDWARARIAAARKVNARTGHVLPIGLESCKDLLEPVPEVEPPHPLADLEAGMTSERAGAFAALSTTLHTLPEFAPWLPDRFVLDDMLRRVGERLGPHGLSNQAAVDLAIKEEMEAATDRFFSPEVREVIASRMRDAAISVRVRDGDRRAMEVLGVARAARDAGLITSPPREIKFLVNFFAKALQFLVQQGKGRIHIPMRSGVPSPATSNE